MSDTVAAKYFVAPLRIYWLRELKTVLDFVLKKNSLIGMNSLLALTIIPVKDSISTDGWYYSLFLT